MIIGQINKLIDAFFTEKGITSYKAAKETGLSEPTINRYRKGESNPTDKNLLKLFKTYPDMEAYFMKESSISTADIKSNENERLKKTREHLGETQASFAKYFGLKQGSYADVERGKVKVSGNIKRILEKEFNVNLQWLDSGEGEMILSSHNTPSSIPMYNFPVAAGDVETYIDPDDVKIIGHLNIPGAQKDSIAIPAYGDSMYPTLTNGDWAVSRPISDPTEIVWGELYYIEWSDYKMYKRLLHADNEDEVILWSDNQFDKIGDRPKFAPITIKKNKIRKLRLVTEILKKPNY